MAIIGGCGTSSEAKKGCLDRIHAKYPFLFRYKSEKYIKVAVPQVAILYRVSQVVCLLGALGAPLYFRDAWALTETPGGTINAWDAPGSMEASNVDDGLASATRYCSSDDNSYSEGNHHLPSPECLALLPGELTHKTTGAVFFTTAYMETVTIGWPCANDVNNTRSAACRSEGGNSFSRNNGQCGCVTQSAVYPLAVEQMLLGFEHSYDTDLLGQGWSALSAHIVVPSAPSAH